MHGTNLTAERDILTVKWGVYPWFAEHGILFIDMYIYTHISSATIKRTGTSVYAF